MERYVFYKNIASLLVCTSSLVLSRFQQYHTAGTIIGLYVSTDYFFADSLDISLHHILAGLFIVSARHLNPQDYLLEAQTIINVEASTFFLTLSHLMKAKILVVPDYIVKANQYLFVLLFTKFRIWDYYWVFIQRESFPFAITKASLYGLFLLNLYWYFLILRKVMKSLCTSDRPHNTLMPAGYDPCFSGRNAS